MVRAQNLAWGLEQLSWVVVMVKIKATVLGNLEAPREIQICSRQGLVGAKLLILGNDKSYTLCQQSYLHTSHVSLTIV